MNASSIRQKFISFFESKGHHAVSSAPIVVKNDPTLMFTNAGMNQFKDYFLGNKVAENARVCNSQKCLRVSGKHNDLEEVGVDHYHHTMFEMLGNWSFGQNNDKQSAYFKKEAIGWAWELLTQELGLNPDHLYATYFAGDEEDNLPPDDEAKNIWLQCLPANQVIPFGKKDNFWEMGDTGPCGPCSELHIDMRSEQDKENTPGADLVNKDHEEVIEIWNLVFMQFNRKSNGKLDPLPFKHVDTGMGFERIVRALQGAKSNYDTDLFMPRIQKVEALSGIDYNTEKDTAIAFRVIADHVRTLAFTIADGQLPSNTGAGYVIRRILRRALRYGYSKLNLKSPFLHELIPSLADEFKSVFPELKEQQEFVQKVILEEEKSFLQTLSKGLDLLSKEMDGNTTKSIAGETAFLLYDTYGFPQDLTYLIARENGFEVDKEGFENALKQQKARGKKDAEKQTGDWVILRTDDKEEFVGYDRMEADVYITRYRKIVTAKKTFYQAVFNLTPFYAEGGGQVGDTGKIYDPRKDQTWSVENTTKENDLIVHQMKEIPSEPEVKFKAVVNADKRKLTTANHSATHLLHAALRQVLGDHVAQKGSLVNDKYLRFDFSHFEKVNDDQLARIENLVNEKVEAAIDLLEERNVPFDEAKEKGAMALFGEKYGETVRVITFDPNYSVELCGGTHVANTANLGYFKIVTESSVAAGIRRIEAVTSKAARAIITEQETTLQNIAVLLKNPKNPEKGVESLLEENRKLKKELEALQKMQVQQEKQSLLNQVVEKDEVNFLVAKVGLAAAEAKDLAFQLKSDLKPLVIVLASEKEGKPGITIAIDETVAKSKDWNAGQLIRKWAQHIKGGGGGQPFFAQAGGKDPQGLDAVVTNAKEFFELNF